MYSRQHACAGAFGMQLIAEHWHAMDMQDTASNDDHDPCD